MSQVILQLFKRNPFSSVDISSFYGETRTDRQIHPMHQYRILSYFDGMCLQNFDKAEDILSDMPCLSCVKKCEYREMAIHAERKKLILFSEEDVDSFEPIRLMVGNSAKASVEEAPFIALVSVSVSCNSSNNTEREKLYNIQKAIETTALDQLTQEDIVFYQVFHSFSGDDLFVLFNANSWFACERMITGSLKKLNPYNEFLDNNTKSDLYQTYTILGYNRVLEEPDKQDLYKRALDQSYYINMRMQTIPGIAPEDAAYEVKRAIPNANIKSVVGHYDLDISAKIELRSFIRLLAPKALLGWYSQISVGTETSIDFAVANEIPPSRKKRILQASDQYFSYMEEQKSWLKKQLAVSEKIDNQCDDCGIPKELTDKLLSLYRVVCQRLVKPQIWGAYTDVRMLIQRYFFLLKEESHAYLEEKERIESLPQKRNKDMNLLARRKNELADSMDFMMNEISLLVNDRIYMDYPSFEHVVNNVYEKGAYEDLIQSLRKWMQMLEEYAWYVTNKEKIINNIKREQETNDLFHVEFSLAPILYGQTESYLLFPSARHAKRLVTVHVSSGEMVKIKEILPSLAHEVGHYTGIVDRMERMRTLFSCSVVMLLVANFYMHAKTTDAGLFKSAIAASADAAGCLLEDMNDSILRIDEQTTLEMAVEEIHGIIMDGISQCEVRSGWTHYLVLLSRYGLVTRISKGMMEWFDKNCYEIINYLINFIREITADVFMIKSTGISFDWYVQILDRQLVTYYVTEDTGADKDDQWISLYARVICIACMYNPKIRTLSEVGKALKKNSTICRMHLGKRIIKILSAIDSSNTSRMQEDLFVLQVLFSCYRIYIDEYIKKINIAHENISGEARCLREKIKSIYDIAMKNGKIFETSKLIKEGKV